jgi:signal transduction histidine kinase
MRPRLVIFVASVVLAAAVLLAVLPLPDLDRHWLDYVGWTIICLAAEMLWIETVAGEGTESMASAANFATAVLWGTASSMWIVAVSTLAAGTLVHRRPWYRTLFNAGQMVVTMLCAGAMFAVLGGPWRGVVAEPLSEGAATEVLRLAVPYVGLGVIYSLVNRLFVGAAVAWSSGRPYLRVLRTEYFYPELAMNDAALFLLSPLMVIAYQAVGYLGLVLFFIPMLVIRNSYLRYVELRKAQGALIHSERMAAKGEMAAEIGHELSNYLAAISGRAQMLLREVGEADPAKRERHARIIWEQAANMATLTKGLMDFSNPEVRIQRVDLNQLIQNTVEFVRPQNKYDTVEFEMRLRSDLPPLQADPGQLQQVLLNLFSNAADALADQPVGRRVISVCSEWAEVGRTVRLEVVDTGSGIPPANLSRVFEPAFTTKPGGHGFGLSTSYRIVANHGGRIEAHNEAGKGAKFVIVLPLRGPAAWQAGAA